MLPIVAEMDYLTGNLTELCGNTEAPTVMLRTSKEFLLTNGRLQRFNLDKDRQVNKLHPAHKQRITFKETYLLGTR